MAHDQVKTEAAGNREESFEYVFKQMVRPNKVESYYAFSDRMKALASKEPGFILQERKLVSQQPDVWVFETRLKFDTAAHCVTWLDNPERRRLVLQEEQKSGFAFEGHANWEGYSRWLSRSLTAQPPTWKVNLLVLLTLYPASMLLTPITGPFFGKFGLPVVMFVNDALCVAVTSWVLVPWVSGVYSAWLDGTLRKNRSLLALVSILILLAGMLVGFKLIPATFW